MAAGWMALALLALQEEGFPLQKGNRWTYGSGERESMIVDAVGPTERDGVFALTVRGGKLIWWTGRLEVSSGGGALRLVSRERDEKRDALNAPAQLVTSELRAGATWSVDSLYANGWDMRFDARVVGRDTIPVPAGTFDAWKIEYDRRHHLGTEYDVRAWYAPGVGFVRFELWRESVMGEKKPPLPKAHAYDLLRFERERRPPPFEPPPLGAEERARAERLLAELAAEELETRDQAAAALVALGRGVVPRLKQARAEAKNPDLRARLVDLLSRFPHLEFTVRARQDRGKVGRPLPLAFALRNLSPVPIHVVPALDDSDTGGRYPRYLLEIRDERGQLQAPAPEVGCGFVNPLRPGDFVLLESGDETDPLGPGTFGHIMLRWKPSKAGAYTVRAVYDATGAVPNAWKGSTGAMDPAALRLLEAMPKGRFESNELRVIVDP